MSIRKETKEHLLRLKYNLDYDEELDEEDLDDEDPFDE